MANALHMPSRVVRVSFLLVALALLAVVILKPYGGVKDQEIQLEGIDLVFVMDISRSMDATDLRPTRLDVAKAEAMKLAQLLAGNRIALVPFANYAFRMLPLTTDVDAVTLFLEDLSTDMIDSQGSDIDGALQAALESFSEDVLTHRAIILFTDGENMAIHDDNITRQLEEQGITLYTVGVGTEKGSTLPLVDDSGHTVGVLRYQGETVVSKLNPEFLSELAQGLNGESFLMTTPSTDVALSLYRSVSRLETTYFGEERISFMQPQYQLFLGLALFLLVCYWFLPERWSPNLRPQKFWSQSLLLLLSLAFANAPLHAGNIASAASAYRQSDFSSALRYYQRAALQDPDNLRLAFNEATVLAELGYMTRATQAFEDLTNRPGISADPEVLIRARYNLGTAYLMYRKPKKAILALGELLQDMDPKHHLYPDVLSNYLLAQYMQQSQSMQNQQNQQQQQEQNQGDSGQSNSNPQTATTNAQAPPQTNQTSSNAQAEQPQSEGPSDVDSLLNIIEDEEQVSPKFQQGSNESRAKQNQRPW